MGEMVGGLFIVWLTGFGIGTQWRVLKQWIEKAIR